jgi:Lipid A 3-O-deacylase (PagL)
VDALNQHAHRARSRSTWWRTVISVFVGVFAGAAVSSAQNVDSTSWFVRTGVTSAYILPANPFMASPDHPGGAIRWGQNLTFEIGRQTDGNEQWHQLYGVPSYGFGVSVASFRNDVEHARPVEAYTFFSWPFARLSDRVDLTTDFGMGMSWHWKEMTDTAASYETSLGSDLNARINWGFYVRYVSTPRITIFTGVDYTHRSNGGMVQPDRGINVIGPKLAVQYSLAPTDVRRRVVQPPKFHPSWEFIAGGTGGVKNVIERREPLTRDNYGSLDATAALQRHFYRFGKIAIGTDLAYDGATGVTIDQMAGESRPAVGPGILRRVRTRHRSIQRDRAGWPERAARIRRRQPPAFL